jgi:hypothetical protein
MTGDRAGLAAQTFLLPTPAAPQAAPVQKPFDDGVQALEGLQYVKGQTADYYKKVADLKSFMQSVQQNLGVDVRVPDLSRPESIKLNQIYRDAIADIQAHGNALKTGFQTENLRTQMNQQYAPGIDPTAQPAGELVAGQDVYSRNAEPAVTELNDKLRMPSYTPQEHKDKQRAKAELEQYYDQMIAQYPERKSYYEYQKAAIISPTQGAFRPSSDTANDRKFGRQVVAAGNYLKKTSNLYLGTDESYQPNERKIDPVNGYPVLESKEFRGRKVGAYILEGWRFYPGSEKTVVLIKDPKSGAVTEQEITEEDAQTIAAGLGNLPIEAMAEYVDKNKLADEYQFVDKKKAAGFLDEESYNTRRASNIKKSESVYNHGFSMAVQDLDSQLSQLKSEEEKPFKLFSIREDDEVEVGRFKIKKTGPSEWEITNIKDIIPVGGMNAASYNATIKDKKTWTNLDDLKQFILSKGYAKEYIERTQKQQEEGEQPPVGTNSAPQEVNPFLQD